MNGFIPGSNAGEKMRRHVVGMSGGGSDGRVLARRDQPLLGQNRVIVAMDDVMRHAGMVGLFGEDRLENLAALALVGQGLVRLGSCDVEAQRMENRRFRVLGISSLQCAHLLLERLGVGVLVLSIFLVNFRECINVGTLTWSCGGITGRNLLGSVE